MHSASLLERWCVFCAMALATAIHVQFNVQFAAGELRIAAADPVLLLGWGGIALAIRRGLSTTLLGFNWRPLAVWGVAVVLWWTVSLLFGRVALGHWSAWALFNKYVGLYLLGGYLAFGLWLGTLPRSSLELCLRIFLVAGGIVATMTIVAFLLIGIVDMPRPMLIGYDFRAAGLLVNPNAYGLLVTITLMFHAVDLRQGRLLAPWLHSAFVVAAAAGLTLTGSRSAWLACAAGCLGLAVWRRPEVVRFGLLLVVGLAIGLLISMGAINELPSAMAKGHYVLSDNVFNFGHHSLNDRYSQFYRAVELWTAHPLFGAGLGVYLQLEAGIGISVPQQIHNSGLWLLAETGMFGFLLIVGFFAIALWRVWLQRRKDHAAPWLAAIFATLLIFAAFSIGQEAMYQRSIWLFVGLGLMLSAQRPQASSLGQ